MENKITKVKKRNGSVVGFDSEKIRNAIFKALTAVDGGDGINSKKLSDKVIDLLNRRFKKDEFPEVEQIQDVIEEVLIVENLVETAKAYILYREQRRKIRETGALMDESSEMVDKYLQELDWQIHENANMTYSLQGLNQYVISSVAKKYWLNKIYPKEIREAASNEDIHIHDLESISTYTFFGREVVIAKLNNQLKLISLRDLYDEINQSEILLNKKDNAWAKYPKDLYVLDKNNWTQVPRLVRKKKEREMRFIKSEQGRSVIVTDNHPFITKEKEIEAGKVKEKEDLIYSTYIPPLLKSENLFSRNYLFLSEELLNKNHKDFFLEGFSWQDFIENWGGSLKAQGTLSASNSANSLNNKLELTEDLGYLVGIFIAEGSYSSWKLTITIGEEDIIKKIQRVCAKLGVRSYVRKKENTKDISINCSTLKMLFEKVFQIKALSKNKNLPPDILTYNLDFAKGVIAGIIDGDGSIDGNKKQIIIRTASRTMLEQIAIMLQFLGFIPRDRAIEGIGTKRIFKGREIIQNFPLYGVSFSKKKDINLPSFKYKKAEPAKKHWRAEDYGWNKVLINKTTTIADDVIYDITTNSNTFLCNGLLVHNCCGWDLYDLLIQGFGGVSAKLQCRPPKHFRTALGQLVNFFFTVQGESAGAQAVSNFDTLLAPFIRYDNLTYLQTKQAMQEFLYNCMVPTRTGFQTPFLNVSLDIRAPEFLSKRPVIIGGQPQKEIYGEFQEEIDMFNKAFYECMMEGDAAGSPFTFPIPTINITHDFPWDDPNLDAMWEATAKYGINYFANFLQSDMNPEDFRSMCCRLRLSNKELYKRGGGLFGSAPLTGSVGVVTINMPRISYLSKTNKEFFERLAHAMDLSKESLEIKRKALEDFIEKGLYPYSKHYLASVKKVRNSYFGNHFSTIGLMGMNEALLNFIGENIASKRGMKFSLEVLDFMRDKLIEYQKETGNLYNLEATPGEGTSYRQAKVDREKYSDIICAGTQKVPYYTNSTQLPVNYTDDVFEALKLQDELQCRYSGGCIEKGNKVLTDKGLINIEDIVRDFKKLKPIKALSYNKDKKVSEWDDILEAVKINVKKHNKIRIKAERSLDITTSDWHPFFVLEKFRPNPHCPICQERVENVKGFAAHVRWNLKCKEDYQSYPKYKVVEKRADELKVGDYILQNSDNLYPEEITELNNDLMWLVGFFIGDGCISKYIDNRGQNNLERYKVRFFSEHQEALEKVVQILNQYFNCQVNIIQNDKRSKLLREISTSKKEVIEFFFQYGFELGEKVYKISVPKRIKENFNNTNVFSFLSGLIDSDGHIDKNQGDFEYYTVSNQLADDILEICSRAGIMISKTLKPTKRKNEVDIWRLRVPGYELVRIKDYLTNSFHSSRIRDGLSNRKRRRLPIVRVKEVSKVNVKDNQFYDLMTKDNHNYLAGKNSLVFVHNTVLHMFLGERVTDIQTVKSLVKKVFEKFHLPYITLTPTFSICPVHGYIAGEHFSCPKCTVKQPCQVYTRIVGYIRPVSQFNVGKQQEFKERKMFKVAKEKN